MTPRVQTAAVAVAATLAFSTVALAAIFRTPTSRAESAADWCTNESWLTEGTDLIVDSYHMQNNPQADWSPTEVSRRFAYGQLWRNFTQQRIDKGQLPPESADLIQAWGVFLTGHTSYVRARDFTQGLIDQCAQG